MNDKMKPPHSDEDDAFHPEEYQIRDPEAFAENMLHLVEEGGRAFSGLFTRVQSDQGPYGTASEMTEATQTLTEVAKHWLNDPNRLAEAQGDLLRSYADLWNTTMKRMLGEEAEPVAEPDPGDNRFKDHDWRANPYFDFWKQAYLVTSRWAEKTMQETEGLDKRTLQKAEFYMRQLAGATSPSNFILTNPEVIRETLSSNGENLVRGMHQLVADMDRSGDLLKISQTDIEAFEVGGNLATTPGKVVFQNDIIQLIHYKPAGKTQYQVPLLIVPPWINKFYILDLTPEKSFIRFAVAQGFSLFVISWVNPDKKLAAKSFEDYMHEGVLAAIDAIRLSTGEDKVNTIGYCVGGTLLASTLAYLAATRRNVINSTTFFTTQTDFSHAGDLLVFTDEDQLRSLEEMMAEKGYLDGSRMANVFNMMRPRDLIWPYIVNNYMLGKKPFPFDLLFWNQDSTRMPAANHGFYLREFYKNNLLARGEMVLSGVRLDLRKIKVPIYDLATREDHIAPAKSVFEGAKLFGGPVRFVLSGSGHIAGVVNPPAKRKYQYWLNDNPATTLESWIEGATETPGSWWHDWAAWLGAHSGEQVKARIPGKGPLKAIEDAPGSYVRTKS